MSQENIETAKGWIARWNRGERSLADDEIHSDVEVESRFRPEPYCGPQGFQQWIGEIDEQFREWRIAVEDWRDVGDDVVALGRIHLRGRTSAVELDQEVGAILEVRDGKLLRLRLFASTEETLDAAGLSE
jgi:ketosteroid isomerase-like protein